jgi:ATP-dependent DNA helicase RecQ
LFRQLVAGGHLAGDQDGYGTLQLAERARAVLKGEAQFRMRNPPASDRERRRERKPRADGVSVAAQDQPLVSALKALRQRLSAEAGVPPYVIFHDRTLVEIAVQRPADEAALEAITGLGVRKIARFGAALIATVSQFKPHPLLQNRLSVTVNQTLALHLQGHDVGAIAARRNLEVSTVLGHFAEAIEAGVVEARAVVGLDEAEIDEILGVFERLGTVDSGRIGPAHAALEGRYDYGVLKCLLAEIA